MMNTKPVLIAALLMLALGLAAPAAIGADKAPMPQTKGMQGMDPKAHEMDCPEGYVRKTDKTKAEHVHKAPGN